MLDRGQDALEIQTNAARDRIDRLEVSLCFCAALYHSFHTFPPKPSNIHIYVYIKNFFF